MHSPSIVKNSLIRKPQGPFDSKKTLRRAFSCPMAKGQTGGPESAVAKRLRILRAMRQLSGPKFAEELGIEYARWNNFERGYPLPAPIALELCRKFPGLTLDWLYRGRLEGMSFDLVRLLEEASVSGKSRTA